MMPWRTIFFSVNLTAAVLFVVFCLIPDRSVDERDTFILHVAIWPAVAFGIAEWVLFSQKNRELEKLLGGIAGFLAIPTTILFVGSIGEAVNGGLAAFRPTLFVGSLIAATYSALCCYQRLLGRPLPKEPRGFAVADRTSP
jgi:hypothetical protein